MSTEAAPVYCEVCRVPHRALVRLCEECGHRLGTRPDAAGARAEAETLKKEIVIGVAICVAMFAINLLLFRGAGIILLAAPFIWVTRNAFKLRGASKRLAHQKER